MSAPTRESLVIQDIIDLSNEANANLLGGSASSSSANAQSPVAQSNPTPVVPSVALFSSLTAAPSAYGGWTSTLASGQEQAVQLLERFFGSPPPRTVGNFADKCTICFEASIELVADPCYHAYTCRSCAEQHKRFASGGMVSCPVCRETVVRFIPCYISRMPAPAPSQHAV